jgi:hypothetical protein
MQRRAGCSVFINPARQPGLHGALPHTWDGGFDQRPRIFFARRVCASASWRLGGGDHAGRSRSWPHNLVGRGWANVAAGVGPRRAEGSLGGPRWSSLGQVPSLLLASHIALQRERGQGVCRPCWVLGEANGQGADQAPDGSGQVSNRGIIAPPFNERGVPLRLARLTSTDDSLVILICGRSSSNGRHRTEPPTISLRGNSGSIIAVCSSPSLHTGSREPASVLSSVGIILHCSSSSSSRHRQRSSLGARLNESTEMWHVRSASREEQRGRRDGELSSENGHTCEEAEHWQTWRARTSSGLYTRMGVRCLGLRKHTSRSARFLSLQRRKSASQIPACRHAVDLHAAKTGTFAWHLEPWDLGRASRAANDRAQNRNVRDPLAD